MSPWGLNHFAWEIPQYSAHYADRQLMPLHDKIETEPLQSIMKEDVLIAIQKCSHNNII